MTYGCVLEYYIGFTKNDVCCCTDHEPEPEADQENSVVLMEPMHE